MKPPRKPRHLVARPRKGGLAYYWQPTPALLAAGFIPRRLPDNWHLACLAAEEHNAGLDAWRAGATAPTQARPDGIEALNALFQQDQAFLALKERSRRDFLYCIRPALEWAADVPVKAITRKSVRTWYRAQRDQRGAANSRNALAALRRLLGFGVDEGWLATNPCLKMGIEAGPSRERVWSLIERDTFCTHAAAAGRPSMAVAVMLGWCLGQRPADLRTLTWAAYTGHAVKIRQGKTGTLIEVPCLPELRQMLDAMPRSAVQVVVSERTGLPYRESDFQHTFADLRAVAGLPADLQFRDLRRTLATALGAAGCTDDQIRAITGHKTRAVVAVYVRPDNTYAEAAIQKLQSRKDKPSN